MCIRDRRTVTKLFTSPECGIKLEGIPWFLDNRVGFGDIRIQFVGQRVADLSYNVLLWYCSVLIVQIHNENRTHRVSSISWLTVNSSRSAMIRHDCGGGPQLTGVGSDELDRNNQRHRDWQITPSIAVHIITVISPHLHATTFSPFNPSNQQLTLVVNCGGFFTRTKKKWVCSFCCYRVAFVQV